MGMKMSTKKVGGIRFISVGRLSVSVCIKRKVARPALSGSGELCCTLASGAFALYGLAQAFARLVTL